MVELLQVPTGIDILDKILAGGLIKGRVYLVSGSTGTGKTTIALQYLLRGIEEGENVALITNTSEKNIIEDMTSLGLSIQDPIKKGSLVLLDINQQFENFKSKVIEKRENPRKGLSKILSEITNVVKQKNIQRLVIDPFTPLVIQSQYGTDYVKTAIDVLSDSSCTTLITSGIVNTNTYSVHEIEESVSGVILLSYDESLKSRFLSLKKMRGSSYHPTPHEFVIQFGKGICGKEEENYNLKSEPDKTVKSEPDKTVKSEPEPDKTVKSEPDKTVKSEPEPDKTVKPEPDKILKDKKNGYQVKYGRNPYD